jgi:aspartyl-tRNA(Asn)/glutamyl-tRNA(Gln) amidotransferase subunit C
MITISELEHLALLSRIELSDSDKQNLLKEFDSILGYIDELKKVKVDLDMTGRVQAVKNVSRQDNPTDSTQDEKDIIMKDTPSTEGPYISVRKVLS